MLNDEQVKTLKKIHDKYYLAKVKPEGGIVSYLPGSINDLSKEDQKEIKNILNKATEGYYLKSEYKDMLNDFNDLLNQ